MHIQKREAITATPFASAEEAWFWCAGIIAMQEEGTTKKDGRGVERPCGPNDIYLILERLVQSRSITLDHVRVLIHYGKLQYKPLSKPRTERERREMETWLAALAALDRPLRLKGIVSDQPEHAGQSS